MRHVNEEINGVNVPWLYCGMLFATFAWHAEVSDRALGCAQPAFAGQPTGVRSQHRHVQAPWPSPLQDHYLYSINYLHYGAGKTWYGVPGQSAPDMERALERHIERAGGDEDSLHGITFVISPAQAGAEGVPVFRLFQVRMAAAVTAAVCVQQGCPGYSAQSSPIPSHTCTAGSGGVCRNPASCLSHGPFARL